MHINKFFIVIVSTVILLTGCANKQNNTVDQCSQIDTVYFKIYGTQDTPISYMTEDTETIKKLYDIINTYTVKDRLIPQPETIELPKGISYVLEFEEDNHTQEYTFIGEYLEFEDDLYKVAEYKSVISSIKELYDIES